MSIFAALANRAGRSLSGMFPAYFRASPKHDHFSDFGWPDEIAFPQLLRMYRRNGLAAAGVDKTILKTWEDEPALWETERPGESPLEEAVAQRLEALRFWQAMAEADRRSMVGRYAGVILRFADGQPFDAPVGRVTGGLMGLVEAIPVWEAQLTVAEWDSDPASPEYGKPKFFQFIESAVGDMTGAARHFRIHPDRVVIWSDDGTIYGRSALEPGFNDLIDAEKVKGAGGEGFWKTSRGAPLIEAPQGARPDDVARAMGVDLKDLRDEIGEQVEAFQRGFDRALMLGGMTAKPMQISLPQPEHFFAAPVQCFAASLGIPVKILLGSQSGERASTEDAAEWARTCNARRSTRVKPILREIAARLERVGVLPQPMVLGWSDLTEASAAEKMERAAKMGAIKAGRDPAFTADEIREQAGYEPLTVELEPDAEEEEAMLR